MSKLTSIVSSLSGYVRVNNNLTFYEKDRVVIDSRNDVNDNMRVKLISGGGSGHEPAHSGYVGYGMLTAAVCGDMFSSPAVQHIINTLLATGTPNCNFLLIVKNYTGDRLNFAVALEVAKARFNYKNVEMVIINDDISIADDKVRQSVGRRGLAGTIFYHKIIGALAIQRKSLEFIVEYVNRLLNNNIICTVGFTFVTNKPDGIKNIEIGKGIHGEPGVEFIQSLDSFDSIYKNLLIKFEKKIPKSTNVIMMVNNLGGTSQFTMNLFLNEIIKRFSAVYGIIKTYTGNFLTSLNSEGISVTLINLANPVDLVDIVGYLEVETSVPCNIFETNAKNQTNEKSVIKDAIELKGKHQMFAVNSTFEDAQNAVLFKNIIARCARDLIENTELLNKIDSEFGNGYTGSTQARFAHQIDLEMKTGSMKSFENPKLIMMQLAKMAQTVVGGTTGALYSLFFLGVTSAIEENAVVNLPMWTAGIKIGVDTIVKYGHAQKGDRTLLDPLLTCCEALDKFTGIQNLNKVCQDAVTATTNLIPKAGRAAYTFSVDEKPRKSNYPDPGAKAIGILVNAITEEIINFK